MNMKINITIYLCFLAVLTTCLNVTGQDDTARLTVDSTRKVNIAYGQTPEKLISSSVSTVSGKDLTRSASTNIGNTLYGRFPGLFVVQGSGEPGYDSPWLRVRGASSDPLIMVDGYERDPSYIAPEEIESVSLLKDAAATALYGMKGANGVILITTKRGAIEKSKINFSVQTGLQTPVKTMEVLNAREYMSFYNQAALNDGLPAKYSQGDIDAAGSSPRYPDVNWKDEILRKGTSISRANLGVSGGSEFIRYFVNLGALYNNGIYKPTNPDMPSNANMTRLNLRGNFDVQITKNTLFTMDLSGSIDKKSFPAFNAFTIWNSMYMLPPNAFNIKNPDGNYGGTSNLPFNPVGLLETTGNFNSTDNLLNAGFRLRQSLGMFVKGLSASIGYKLDNAVNNTQSDWRNFQTSQIAPGTGDSYTYYIYGQSNPYSTWSSANRRRFTGFDADVIYNMPVVNGHKVDVMLRFHDDEQWKDNNDITPYITRSYGGRIQYGFNGTYLFEVAGSYYGSEQYSKDNRYALFPAFAASWVFSNEGFLSSNAIITYGKLRASYGKSGSNPYVSGKYPYNSFYRGGGYFPLGDKWVDFWGLQPGKINNADIKNETSAKTNIGLDLNIKNNISFVADFYIDKRSDMLFIDYTRPSIAGGELPYENIGKITNTGFDAKLGYNSNSNGFNWYGNLIFSYFKNTIDEMGETKYPSELSHLSLTGHPINTIFGYEVIGSFASDAEIQSSPVQTTGNARVGDLKYKDINGDNVIDHRDMTAIGNQSANVDLGLQAGFTYRNFDFEILLQGQFNRDAVLSNALYQPFIVGNSVTKFVKESDFPKLTLSNHNNYVASSYWVRSVDFVKLRNVEVGYTLSANWMNKLSIEKFRVFLRGSNLLTLSGWKYTDPEFTWIGYSPMKVFYAGVNIEF